MSETNRTLSNPGTPAAYADAYRAMLAEGRSLEELNEANHLALAQGIISMSHFRAAARVLADEILRR